MKRCVILLGLAAFCFVAGAQDFRTIQTRKNTKVSEWSEYPTRTLDRLKGFKLKKTDPATDQYGGWTCCTYDATGFFHTCKDGDRWWIVDPEGHPYIFKGVAVFSVGHSDRQKQALKDTYGSMEAWADAGMEQLRGLGFNGLGAWSSVEQVRNSSRPMPYTVIVSPMGRYRGQHLRRFGGKYLQHGWQNYRFDLAMVFDPEFDKFVESELARVSAFKDDPWLVGYFTDNEIPWVNDALDRHLTLLAHDEPAYLAVRKWFEERRGRDARPEDITQEDRDAFMAFYLDTYLSKVTTALRKWDTNHMYLGCRFNQWREELHNKAMFEVAGRYMDIISVNHYQRWTPNMEEITNFEKWSGKPFIVTEFYTKGEDSDLPNTAGAGWNVHTQDDRGWFYQNFCLQLLESKCCVGWHWFKYMDNDPEDLTTDYSNRDSNKGMVKWNFEPYPALLEKMKQLNDRTYRLIKYFDE
ncbi:MAG: hypothetical protein J5764_05615 [Bacteroidales bacterium]|nr:hypothetical protein [Bacteroidales bacterium]